MHHQLQPLLPCSLPIKILNDYKFHHYLYPRICNPCCNGMIRVGTVYIRMRSCCSVYIRVDTLIICTVSCLFLNCYNVPKTCWHRVAPCGTVLFHVDSVTRKQHGGNTELHAGVTYQHGADTLPTRKSTVPDLMPDEHAPDGTSIMKRK